MFGIDVRLCFSLQKGLFCNLKERKLLFHIKIDLINMQNNISSNLYHSGCERTLSLIVIL